MRNIFKSRLGRASVTLAIAGLTVLTAGASAEARPFIANAAHWGHHGYYAPHYWGGRAPYYGRPYYGPRYYAPPVVTYPQPYYYGYAPAWPSLNLNFPLG